MEKQRIIIPWETLMLAGFVFSIPFMVVEFLRPGVVTEFIPVHMFAFPFIFIIPAAFERDAKAETVRESTDDHEPHVC